MGGGVILGTAGHIDHGKTTLVRALTGVDTDRLPEERRRGITIELGFAPLPLPGGATMGIVDVPGHEAFVRTMLAGATGIDLALLVVAADEGPMPQTREHVAILTILGIRGGVVALTKCDAVDREWIDLVRDEVRRLLEKTPLEGAPIVPVSATTGEGVEAVRDAIASAAAALPGRDADDLFRMPVDRAFTVRGTGTVVTGTVWSGSVAPDDSIRVLPGGHAARVRTVQVHGRPADAALPGTRTALALHGLTVEDASRGSVLVRDPSWQATRVLRADVRLLADCAASVGPRTRLRFHLGTTEVGARVVVAGRPLAAGDLRAARVVLDGPVIARAGDRFVLRGGTPPSTVGGGAVTDPLPEGRRVRPWDSVGLPPAARLARFIAEARADGVDPAALPVRLGVTPQEAARLVRQAPGDVIADGRLVGADVLRALVEKLEAALQAHHERAPLEPGASLQWARSLTGGSPDLADRVIERAVAEGRVVRASGMVARGGWAPELTPGQERTVARMRSALDSAGLEPPSVGELEAAHGGDVAGLLRMLERDGQVVQVEENRFYSAAAIRELEGVLRAKMSPGAVYGPADLRAVVGVSRKYLIPLLEHCDRVGVTDRRDGGRVLRGT